MKTTMWIKLIASFIHESFVDRHKLIDPPPPSSPSHTIHHMELHFDNHADYA